MGELNIATLYAIIRARDEASAELAKVRASLGGVGTDSVKLGETLQAVGGKMQTAGIAMSAAITVPLVAAAGAALKFSTDFESSMVKIETLSGVSADTVADMREQILALAPAVGVGPVALADALLVVTSTGLRGAEAMEILEQSAKATAIGLGSTVDVARALTSAITAYGKENLSASDAANKLFVAVREGGAEADEFAGVLGRVVGLAAQMGVSFDEVTASVATFTRLGVNAEEAVTALRGTLSNFLNPAEQVKEVLASIGLTATDVRNAIREDGLAATLTDLVNRLHGNEEAIGTLIPNVRALAGVLGTAGAQGEAYREVLDQIKNSSGELDEAFERAAKTGKLTWDQFTATGQALLIQFGDELAPVFFDIIRLGRELMEEVLAPLISGFASLPEPVKMTAIALAGIAAALGPLLLALGSLATGAASIAMLLGGLGGAAAIAAGPVGIGALIVALAAIAVPFALTQIGNELERIKTQADLSRRELLPWSESAKIAAEHANEFQEGTGKANEALKLTGAQLLGVRAAIQEHTGSTGAATEATKQLADTTGTLSKELKAYEAAINGIVSRISGADASEAADQWAKAVERIGGMSRLSAEDQKAYNEVLGEAMAAMERMSMEVSPKMIAAFEDTLPLLESSLPKAVTEMGRAYLFATVNGDKMAEHAREQMNVLQGLTKDGLIPSTDRTKELGQAMLTAAPGFIASADAAGLMADEIDRLNRVAANDATAQGLLVLGDASVQLGTNMDGAAGVVFTGVGRITEAFAELEKANLDEAGNRLRTAGQNMAMAVQSWAMGGIMGYAIQGFIDAANDGPTDAELRQAREMMEEWSVEIVDNFNNVATAMQHLEAAGDESAMANILLRDTLIELGLTAEAAAGVANMHMRAIEQAMTRGPEAMALALDEVNDIFAQYQGILEDWERGVTRFNEGLAMRAEGFLMHADQLATMREDLLDAEEAAREAFSAQQELVEQLKTSGKATEDELTAALLRMEELFAEWALAKDEAGRGTDEFKAELNRLGLEFDIVAMHAVSGFGIVLSQTGSVIEALEAVKPPLDALIQAERDFGFEGSAAVDKLLRIRELVAENEDVFTSIEGLRLMMEGLGQAGLFTKEDFELFGRDAVAAFDTLRLRGISVNDAFGLMQPTLQALWEAQERLGIEAAGATGELLSQAEAVGIVGPEQKSVFEQIHTVLLGIENAILRLPEALREATLEARILAETIGRIPSPDAVFPGRDAVPRAHEGVYIDRAHDGMYLGLASDEVPIIAQTGEAVLNRRAVTTIGGETGVNALNSGEGLGGLSIHVSIQGGTIIGNSREFEDAVTRGTIAGLERGGANLSKARTIVKQLVHQ